ncbi:M48 family metallopeptidase [Reyranella sp.]|uniref:M48 family metallopeptidase n=1 Tax=Reyranella sp. TaxID=1929291 RepID=UPI003C7A08B0
MAARYYDGVTADVQEVTLKVTSHELLISRSEDSSLLARWPVADMFVLGDSHHEAVPPLALRGSEARLVVEDPAWRAQLVSLVPALKPLALEPVKVAPRLGAYSLAIVALVGLFWSVVEYGTGYAAPLLPYSWQVKLGETVLDEITADEEVCTGTAGLAAINRLANDLAKEAGYPHEVTVHVVKGKLVNAFTLPGGILVFYSALIDDASSTQVAGVLAHEIGHVVHFHPTKGVVRAFGIDMLIKLLTGGYSDVLTTVGSGGTTLLAMRNGRAFEREADETGVHLLEQRGLRADGVSTFFEKMMKEKPDDAASAAGIWSSHPPTQERITATKRPPNGKLPFTTAEWQALRNVCK